MATAAFRQVPYRTPEAERYHAAHGYAKKNTNDESKRIKFAWTYVDNYSENATVQDAWENEYPSG